MSLQARQHVAQDFVVGDVIPGQHQRREHVGDVCAGVLGDDEGRDIGQPLRLEVVPDHDFPRRDDARQDARRIGDPARPQKMQQRVVNDDHGVVLQVREHAQEIQEFPRQAVRGVQNAEIDAAADVVDASVDRPPRPQIPGAQTFRQPLPDGIAGIPCVVLVVFHRQIDGVKPRRQAEKIQRLQDNDRGAAPGDPDLENLLRAFFSQQTAQKGQLAVAHLGRHAQPHRSAEGGAFRLGLTPGNARRGIVRRRIQQ